MKKICVYTCLTGNYDNLSEVEVIDKNVDFICYTNNRNIKSNTWKIFYIDNEDLNDHQLSRKIKMLGTDYINENYDVSVWQDASVIWKNKPSLFVKEYASKEFSAFTHNERNSVFDEAKEVIRLKKDDQKRVKKHIEFLKKEKFPDNLGLYEMTVFIKNNKCKKVQETMQVWFDTYLKYSKRDQLSFMYAVWKTKLNIKPIHMNVWNNEWVKHIKHNFKEDLTECRIYFEENIEDNNPYDYKYKIKNDTYSISTTIPKDTSVIEIEVTDVPCIKFNSIKINTKYESIQVFNTIPFYEQNIFYTNKGIVRINGSFKKGNKFNFSIELKKLSVYEKYNLIEQLGNDLIVAAEDIEILKEQRDSLNKRVNDQEYMMQHPIRNLLKYMKKKIIKKSK